MDMLRYNVTYQVLICGECQYAIQKSAVSSHLLRHKIYRNDRQRLLSYIAGLDLLEPEQVPLPAPDTPPVDGLSTVAGYRCIQYECGNLCASVKRMKKHQNEVHRVEDLSHLDTFARPAWLQTFFKGTKLRYFEVTPVSEEVVATNALGIARLDGDESSRQQEGELATTLPMSHHGIPGSFVSSQFDFLDTIQYFHYYTTKTYWDLPPMETEPGSSTEDFWKTTLVGLAIEHKWLMCGLLAMSASHLVLMDRYGKDAETEKKHCDQAIKFMSGFANGFYGPERNDLDSDLEHNSEILVVSEKMHCILRQAVWALRTYTIHDQVIVEKLYIPFSTDAFFVEVNQLTVPNHERPPVPSEESIFTRAQSILGVGDRCTPEPAGVPKSMLERLRVLPSQLTAMLGRPDHVQDPLAILSATAALAVCYKICYDADSIEEVLLYMMEWRVMAGHHFETMLSQNNAAALVLLAYWTSLVKRAEAGYMWFMFGSADAIVREVATILAEQESELLPLVQDLIA
jgi:hypothetical protein